MMTISVRSSQRRPIFEDEKGVKIKAEVEVKTEGVAGMKIINDQLVEYHKLRIAI